MTINIKGNEFYFDPMLARNLDCVKKDLKKDYDAWIIFDGMERSGKSTFAAQCAYYIDNDITLDRVCFTATQFIEALRNAKPNQAIIFDEAFKYLASRRSMSLFNYLLISVMTEIGYKNLAVMICIPTFFELDKYPAIHRSIALLHITNRGTFNGFSYAGKKLLYLWGKKGYNYAAARHDFHGTFTSFFPFNKEEYNAKKAKYAGVIDDLQEEITKLKQGQTEQTKAEVLAKLKEIESVEEAKQSEDSNDNQTI